MNAKDFIHVLEYMKAFNKAPKTSSRKKPKSMNSDDFDLIALLRHKQQEARIIEDFLKEQEKLSKKEEKKEEEKKKQLLSMPQLTMLLVMSFPIIAPLYVNWFKAMMGVH